ncbi:MAG TPA: hypothetical protein VIY09_06995 [Rhizomicrobium sp.]
MQDIPRNAAEDALGEIGQVLAPALAVALAIDMALVALHVG